FPRFRQSPTPSSDAATSSAPQSQRPMEREQSTSPMRRATSTRLSPASHSLATVLLALPLFLIVSLAVLSATFPLSWSSARYVFRRLAAEPAQVVEISAEVSGKAQQSAEPLFGIRRTDADPGVVGTAAASNVASNEAGNAAGRTGLALDAPVRRP
ncbi:unnamed protein product, partial [Closterium sp. NIES-53]